MPRNSNEPTHTTTIVWGPLRCLTFFAAAAIVFALIYRSHNYDGQTDDARPQQQEPLLTATTDKQHESLQLTSGERYIKAEEYEEFEENYNGREISEKVGDVYVKWEVGPDPHGSPILLLHGAKFSSATWSKTETYDALVSAGFTVYGIDLPGFARSQGSVMHPFKSNFLLATMDILGLDKPVIVSPSMSGSYSLPTVTKHADLLSGFVPVAPVGVSDLSDEDISNINIPMLVVYGTKDISGKKASLRLSKAKHATMVPIKDGSHPCYLDNPTLFNTRLVKFLRELRQV